MYKITFDNSTTASLVKLNNQFALVTPELSQEAHAALCLFLPNENLDGNQPQELYLYDEVKTPEGKYAYIVGWDETDYKVALYGGDLGQTWPKNQLSPTGELIKNSFSKGVKVILSASVVGTLLWLNSSTSACVELDDTQERVDYPLEHLRLAKNLPSKKPHLPPGTIVLAPLDSGWSRASVLEDKADGFTRVDTGKEELVFTRAALIEVHSQDKRRIDLEDIKEGDLLRVVTNCKGLKLGEVVTFRKWVPDQGVMKIDIKESVKLFNARHFQLN